MNYQLISISSSKLKIRHINSICILKDKYWKFGIKSQKEWYDGQMYHEPRLFKNEDGHWIKIRKFDGERGGYEYHDNLNTEEVIHKYEYTKEVAA